MSVLSWEKPKRAQSVEKWKSLSADGAPPGVYTPNMSSTDMLKWKAKLVGTKSGLPRIEIRKTANSQVLIIVSQGGFPPKCFTPDIIGEKYNIHISANGPIWLTWAEMDEMKQAIEEAKAKLQSLSK
jgi:hypothetical protein